MTEAPVKNEQEEMTTNKRVVSLIRFMGTLNIILGILFFLGGLHYLITPPLMKKIVDDYRQSISAEQPPNEPPKDVSELYPPDMPDGIVKLLRNPKALNFYTLNGRLMVFGNLLLFLSGLGLVNINKWGRILGLIAAGYKIVFIAVADSYYIFSILPLFNKSKTVPAALMILSLGYHLVLLLVLSLSSVKLVFKTGREALPEQAAN